MSQLEFTYNFLLLLKSIVVFQALTLKLWSNSKDPPPLQIFQDLEGSCLNWGQEYQYKKTGSIWRSRLKVFKLGPIIAVFQG